MSSDQPAPRRGGRKRAIRWVLTAVVVGVVGFFFARALWENWDQIQAEHLSFDPWWIAATVIFAVAVPITGVLWARIVRTLEPGARISSAEAVAVQCASWLLKYIPGQVGSVVNKVVWARKKDISRTLVVISFVYENVFLQLASILPSVVILLLSLGPQIFGDNVTILVLPLVIVVPLILVLSKPLFHAVVSLPVRRVLKKDVPADYFLSPARAIQYTVEFLLPRIVNGIGFVIICATVVDVDPSEWLPFAAAYVLAGAVGILAFFVPSGLGVREAVIVLILGQFMSVPEAIVISLLARLISTVGDSIVALFYVGIRRTIPKEYRP